MIKQMENRPYQQRIISKAAKNWAEGINSQLVESPPGSGKTIMGFTICRDLIQESSRTMNCDPNEIGIGWVAMRRNLLKQAINENETMIKCPNVFPISMFDKHIDDNPLMRFKHRILVVDEAHHDATDSCATIHNLIKPEKVLGLSATPLRTDRVKLCFEVTLKDAGFYTLIEEGYLSKFNQWMLDDFTPQSVVGAYLEDPTRWGKSIMFFLTYQECEEAFRLLNTAGVRCEIVTGQTDRFRQIDDFEDGKLDVLINMFVLTEGFDSPELKTVWVRDSANKGPTIQMSGRVLRKHPEKPIANIVQSVKTKFPFTRVARASNQYIRRDGEWGSVGTSEMIRVMSNNMLNRFMNVKATGDETLNWLKNKSARRPNNRNRDRD